MPAIFRRPLFWIVVLVVLLIGVVTTVLTSQATAKKAALASASKVVDSPFAAIASGKIDVEGGVIQVAARTAGIVREVYVQEGQTVQKGDVLARLEDDQLRLAANQARAGA